MDILLVRFPWEFSQTFRPMVVLDFPFYEHDAWGVISSSSPLFACVFVLRIALCCIFDFCFFCLYITYIFREHRAFRAHVILFKPFPPSPSEPIYNAPPPCTLFFAHFIPFECEPPASTKRKFFLLADGVRSLDGGVFFKWIISVHTPGLRALSRLPWRCTIKVSFPMRSEPGFFFFFPLICILSHYGLYGLAPHAIQQTYSLSLPSETPFSWQKNCVLWIVSSSNFF